jgi:hypothetical protein
MQAVARLVRQQAPSEAVLECLVASKAWKCGQVEAQWALVESLCIGCGNVAGWWDRLPYAYRRRLVKRFLALLDTDTEVHETLLDAYVNAPADAEPGWSTQSFLVPSPHDDEEEGVELMLRVAATIGGANETGGRVWPAALALTAYLLAHPPVGIKRAVELGAGPGLPGLTLAASTSRAVEAVVLTDAVSSTLDNLERNAARLPLEAASRVHVRYLDWRDSHEETAACLGGVELLLAADVVYEPAMAEPLIRTLSALLHHPGSEHCAALLAAEQRHGEAWVRFEELLSERIVAGELTVVDRSEAARTALRSEGCPFWCGPDTIDRIILLEVTAPTLSSAAPASVAVVSSAPLWRPTAAHRVDAGGVALAAASRPHEPPGACPPSSPIPTTRPRPHQWHVDATVVAHGASGVHLRIACVSRLQNRRI